MKKKLMVLLLLFSVFAKPSFACIGKTIVIGYKNNAEQRILAEILYVIITERTGTTVVLKSYSNVKECSLAIAKGEISLYVDYIGAAYNELEHKNSVDEKNKNAIFEFVKNDYEEKKNLIWLNLFGFESESLDNEYLHQKGLPCNAAPIISKETFKMFPVLPRLLNKLGGKIDNAGLNILIKSVENDKVDPRVAAQNFLKNKKLI